MDAEQAILPLVIALVVALFVAVGFGWTCYRLLVDRGRLLLRLDALADAAPLIAPAGLAPGAFLNDFALPARDGQIVTLSELPGVVLVVVLQADCLYSRAFAAELRRLLEASASPLLVLIVSGARDDAEDLRPLADLPGLLLLDRSGLTAKLLRIAATPAGYLSVDRRTIGPRRDGPAALIATWGGASVMDEQQTPLALTSIAADAESWRNRTPLRPGDLVPDITLSVVGGGDWSPRSELGASWLLLLVDPLCPPCAAVLAELGAVFSERLVIVSRGEMSALNRAGMPPGTLVATQPRRELARALGVVQTPAAYAIDKEGRITAGPAIGLTATRAMLADYPFPHGTPSPAVSGTHHRGGRGNG